MEKCNPYKAQHFAPFHASLAIFHTSGFDLKKIKNEDPCRLCLKKLQTLKLPPHCRCLQAFGASASLEAQAWHLLESKGGEH